MKTKRLVCDCAICNQHIKCFLLYASTAATALHFLVDFTQNSYQSSSLYVYHVVGRGDWREICECCRSNHHYYFLTLNTVSSEAIRSSNCKIKTSVVFVLKQVFLPLCVVYSWSVWCCSSLLLVLSLVFKITTKRGKALMELSEH